MAVTQLDQKTLIQFYEQLWRIRLFEEQVDRLGSTGQVPGFPHLSTGQEAVAVGVCAVLKTEDYLFSGHRAHGHVLAKGSDLYATFAEVLGRVDGLCRGRGGSMHLADGANGVMGATGVVGGNIPLAAGAAWAAKEQDDGRIAVVFFGDGATGSGVFHETLNLASLWQLPVLLVCENNGYAEFTSRAEHSKVAKVGAFAAPYNISSRTVDGNDVLAVYAAAREAVHHLREGGGPWLLECMTYRLAGHYVGDPQKYRDQEELAAWRDKDPIQRLHKDLLEQGADEKNLAASAARVREELAAVVARALAAGRPDPNDVLADVYTTEWPAARKG